MQAYGSFEASSSFPREKSKPKRDKKETKCSDTKSALSSSTDFKPSLNNSSSDLDHEDTELLSSDEEDDRDDQDDGKEAKTVKSSNKVYPWMKRIHGSQEGDINSINQFALKAEA